MIPLNSNFTYDVNAFEYQPNRSMAGVFYVDEEDIPRFNYLRPYPSLKLPQPHFFNVPIPFTICSSTAGLLLCYDHPNGCYHVFNPFIRSPSSYRRIPDINRPHDTLAVLDVDLSSKNIKFSIICPVEEDSGVYTFDIYSSAMDMWSHDGNELIIGHRSVLTRTGVSYGNGTACWLTNEPPLVIMYKVGSGTHRIKIPETSVQQTLLQLGSINVNSIALIASSPFIVKLFIYTTTTGSWQEHRSFKTSGKTMHVMRFETEVPLRSMDNVVGVWEMVDRKHSQGRGWLHEMPRWKRDPPQFGDCVPYVSGIFLPDEFTEFEEDIKDSMTAEVNREARTPRRKRSDKSQEAPEQARVSRRKKLEYDVLEMIKTESLENTIMPYDFKNFRYKPGRSMAGVFFIDADSNPAFCHVRPYPCLKLPEPKYFDTSHPFTICSSSSGLLLCFDFITSSYHVFNPYVHHAGSYSRIPAPEKHELSTPAVLVVETSGLMKETIFHIICPIEITPGNYTFDRFSSDEDEWTEGPDDVVVETDCQITANTGVSNSKGMAFWLTTNPYQVVRYTIAEVGECFVDLLEFPEEVEIGNLSLRAQLGRIADAAAIGLVVVNRDDVRVFCLKGTHWRSFGPVTHVKREGGVMRKWGDELEVVCRGGTVMPEVMRFEEEVVLFIGGGVVVVVELSDVEHESTMKMRLHEMPLWLKMPPVPEQCVPYVTSRLVPGEPSRLMDT